LDRAREQFEQAGVNLVLIGQRNPEDAAEFRRSQKLHLPVLADRKRVSYRAAGTRMAGVSGLLGPKVVAKGLATTVRTGLRQGRTVGHAAQLGGALLILPDSTVTWSHISEDASDNASPQEILAALPGSG
jgi:AhpC/TSA antioxidant enzyme